MNGYEKIGVLFVCMGNICRSPMAEGVFRRLVEESGLSRTIQVDSAGTHSYHTGAAPDERSQATALRRGVDLGALRARRVMPEDFERFDYILAMDRQNLQDLLLICRQPEHREKVRLFLEFAPESVQREVPDPYYGGLSGFDRVMDLVEEAAQGLLVHLRERHRS
ncbi:MAG: low molecular weight phosphotyrosine protein phosphatase [Gammaproteobacteria bacterium]|nr:low molecular weight phosphotyrosine protein phosphatase [Gammaproteobacteria bacterium]MCP5425412.1 low molecular weight phosphotyrosine protein phosphatase [Gammaproteobacteria bacterium]MCP5459260.1 low molecular weight phosphotyrosine protein phosphatase [Gammaproteobacteria bacterium]